MVVSYLYAIVPEDAAEPPPTLLGLEGCPVRLLRAGGVAAVIAELPAALYAEDELNRHLTDLEWVGERGIAHERVLTWYADRGPIIPLSLFSLHQNPARIRERLEQESKRFLRLLRALTGRREWGVRISRSERGDAQLQDRSPRLRALADEIAAAAPGKRFLLTKKRDAAREQELRATSTQIAARAYQALREVAERATIVPRPAPARSGQLPIVLDAFFLVPDAELEAFQRRVAEVADRCLGDGLDPLFTGPWPPYHFADLDDA